jgi:hypothetical protein
VIVESELKMWDKMSALQLLGRKLRLFVDKIEVESSPQDLLYKELLKSLKEEQTKVAN